MDFGKGDLVCCSMVLNHLLLGDRVPYIKLELRLLLALFKTSGADRCCNGKRIINSSMINNPSSIHKYLTVVDIVQDRT